MRRRGLLLSGLQLLAGLAILPFVVLPQWETTVAVRIVGVCWLVLAVLSSLGAWRGLDRLLVFSLWASGLLVGFHTLVTGRAPLQVLDGLELLVLGIFAAFSLKPREVHWWLGVCGAFYLVAVVVNPADLAVWLGPIIAVLVVATTLVVVHLLQMVTSASTHDALTGALNRYGLTETATVLRSADDRAGAQTSVAFLDVDGFKAFNDTHGHTAGDDLLAGIVAALRANLRAHDLIARVGGDEFLVVFANTHEDRAREIMNRCMADLPIACSVGVARWEQLADLDAAIDAADAEMYDRKRDVKRRRALGDAD